MNSTIAGSGRIETSEGVILVRYWASVRASAGVASEELSTVEAGPTLASLHAALAARHPDGDLAPRLLACAVLVGARPVGSQDPATVALAAGDEVEFLPPFAGG